MSRAFVKESDGDDTLDALPERTHSDLPNYITEPGLATQQRKVQAMETELATLGAPQSLDDKARAAVLRRDLAYDKERLRRAIPVPRSGQVPAEVRFGVRVSLLDDAGNAYRFTLVGEDETDPPAGRVSWASPIGRALLNREVGDVVVWRRGAVDLEVEIIAIDYPDVAAGKAGDSS